MPGDIFFELHGGLPRQNPGRNRYTRQAYRMLPKLDKPRNLDIGCSSGVPTLELVGLSLIEGERHRSPAFLDELTSKARKADMAE